MEAEQFNATLDSWSEALANRIVFCRNTGKSVYIIALSRKMPRFFDWLQKAVASGTIESPSVKRLCKMLESEVEIATEYAIPLIFKGYGKSSTEKTAGIIADDVIIFGATLQKVSMQWWAFSGEIPYVIALFRGTRSIIAPILESEASLKLPRLSDEVLESALDTISSNIHSTSLPIDVEYPLIYSDLPYAEVKAYIQKKCPSEWKRYEVKSSSYIDSSESFTVMIGNARKNGLTNDHAKIRLFRKQTGCCIEMISPSHIDLANLKNHNLFSSKDPEQAETSRYDTAWQYVLDAMNIDGDEESSIFDTMQEVLINRGILSTLVIWAEYLYGLSAFVSNQALFFPEEATPYVKKSDLALILGENTANHVMEDVTAIITERKTINPDLDKASLQEYVNPSNIKDEYLVKVISALKDDVEVSDNLDSLFRVSHFSGDICRAISNKNHVGHHCIGESFESIIGKISHYHPEDKDLLKEINRWVDVRIDECRIAPKYEIVVGSDGRRYFRRFFLCGSNKI